MDEDNVLGTFTKIVDSCLVPVLDKNIDQEIISSENFTEFRLILNENLHLLLDILYKHEQFLMLEEEELDLRMKKVQITNFH